jgi:hypothetical protein
VERRRLAPENEYASRLCSIKQAVSERAMTRKIQNTMSNFFQLGPDAVPDATVLREAQPPPLES